jgi:hypothetical protein
MPTVILSLKRTRSDQEQPCGVCGAAFIPLEDSGARVLKMKTPEQDILTGLMCGGCHSKWSGGTTVNLNTTKE